MPKSCNDNVCLCNDSKKCRYRRKCCYKSYPTEGKRTCNGQS